jgi:hypothetical protein
MNAIPKLLQYLAIAILEKLVKHYPTEVLGFSSCLVSAAESPPIRIPVETVRHPNDSHLKLLYCSGVGVHLDNRCWAGRHLLIDSREGTQESWAASLDILIYIEVQVLASANY